MKSRTMCSERIQMSHRLVVESAVVDVSHRSSRGSE